MENNQKTLQLKTITKITMENNKKTSWDHDPCDCSKKSNENQKKPVTVPKNPKFNCFRIFGLPPGPSSPSQSENFTMENNKKTSQWKTIRKPYTGKQ